MGVDRDDEEALDGSTLAAAIAAFDSLSDETRRATVVELLDLTFDASAGVSFSDLRRAVGVRDPGRFHYHVDRLAETFLTKRDDEYWPRYGSTFAAISFAACHRPVDISALPLVDTAGDDWTVATRYTCPHCETFLGAWYDDREQLRLHCADHGAVFYQVLPPGITDADPQTWVDAAVRRSHHDAETFVAEQCPSCRGNVEPTVRTGRPTYSFDSPETVPWTPLWCRFRCRDCAHERWFPLGAALSTTAAARRWFHERGVDVRTEPCPSRYVCSRSTDGATPFVDRATVTYRVDGDRLAVTVGSELAILSVDRDERPSDSDRQESDTGDGATASPAVEAGTHAAGLTAPTRTVYDPDVTLSAQPTVTGDLVCVLGRTGDLHALDRATGERRWRVELAGGNWAPAVADGTLYVGDFSGTVAAVDCESGRIRWSTTVDGRPILTPTVVDGTLYVGVQEQGISAFDAESGAERWSTDLGERGAWLSGPVHAGGRLLVGGRESLFAVDADSGAVTWRAGVGAPPRVGGVVDGTALLGAGAELLALDAAGGDPVWRVETDGTVRSPAVADGVVCATADDRLWRVDPTTGDEQWQHSSATHSFARPTLRDGTAFAAEADGRLVAVDVADGTESWAARPCSPHRIECGPAVVDGTVFVGSFDGGVAAVDATDGTRLWHRSVDE